MRLSSQRHTGILLNLSLYVVNLAAKMVALTKNYILRYVPMISSTKRGLLGLADAVKPIVLGDQREIQIDRSGIAFVSVHFSGTRAGISRGHIGTCHG